MKLRLLLANKARNAAIAVASIGAGLAIAIGGGATVLADSSSTYDCGTYGSGNYDQGCTTTTTGGGSTSTGSTSSGSTSSGSSSTSTTSTNSATDTTTPAAPTGSTLLNSDTAYSSTAGKTMGLTVGEVLYFNLGGVQHTITVKSFDASTMVVSITGTGTDATDVSIPMGQTVKYDVDGDGTPDIAITYSALSSDGATATGNFRSLTTVAPTSTGTSTGGSTSSTSDGATTSTSSSSSMWWLWLIPIIIGVGLIIWAIIATLKRRKAANQGGGSNFNQF